jgi:hypothetical protein
LPGAAPQCSVRGIGRYAIEPPAYGKLTPKCRAPKAFLGEVKREYAGA